MLLAALAREPSFAANGAASPKRASSQLKRRGELSSPAIDGAIP
jgi:hypothetical protein